MGEKTVIFWISDTDKILKGEKPRYGIGGANVQLAFWAHTFALKGYNTFALTRSFSENGKSYNQVKYIWHPVIRYVGSVLNYFTAFVIVLIKNPSLIVSRAKVPELKFLQLLSKYFGFKLVHMLASDEDVMLDENGTKTKFQKALQTIDFVIAQNSIQKKLFNHHFKNIDIPIIPNIWDNKIGNTFLKEKKFDFIWVANFVKNKRPLWLVELAKYLPQYKFVMIGAAFDRDLYLECEGFTEELGNLEILGYKSLFEVNSFVKSSRILVCTSIIEGFPNTFLQALSVNVPLLSTVDPNGVICDNRIGEFCADIDSMKIKASNMLEDHTYEGYVRNISEYYIKTHSPDSNFQVLEDYLNTDEM
jgi:glycosyltransferase involved in cell wall biosynthesis